MPSPSEPLVEADAASDTGPLGAIAEAVGSGAGLPALARAAARALDAGVVVADRGGAVLAVAARSRDEERRLLAARGELPSDPLVVAGEPAGSVVLQHRGEPDAGIVALVLTVLALEVERVRAPARASQEEAAAFCTDLLNGDLDDPETIVGRGTELGLDLSGPVGSLVVRVHPHVSGDDGWRARALAAVERGARSVSPSALVGAIERPNASACEITALVPAPAEDAIQRAARAAFTELDGVLPGHGVSVGHGRTTEEPGELPRAVQEALLACNVGEGDPDQAVLGFEETGAYRLLLSAMSENPDELRRFYAETIEPLAAYDAQYETDLVGTVTAYLDADGSVAAAAQRLFTHRHTVRYRLERVRELCGLDVTSSDGRERLSLGLKAMRVLGLGQHDGAALGDRDARPRRGSGGRRTGRS
ncbi:helix-turn-helix domain-containing protein [Patulibacter brassicae]|uniref:Helix-turn-helix domain-containing protein n=1 Tax=Patulibacter brassicae TaxID=1705717 RepID=A0ABU4VIM9_9ACTN|nr:helix-turn-helix domain-containing protein [Patulibacter brassicae]MDX8151202.1 helix-turn-helix domain-containing protein [Patulibacter brassicae]